MIKICYVTTITGSLKFFKSQMDYLASNGYDVYAISSDTDKQKKQISKNAKFIPVNISRGISPFTLKKSVSELKKIFKEHQFDIVQYSTPNAAFVASIAAKMAGIKIRNYHLMGFRYLGETGILRYILKLIEKATCKNSTHIECVSKSNLEFGIKEKIFKPEKATIVWNGSTGGIDLKRFDFSKRQEWRKEIREELGYTEDDFVFGFAGRITKDKGINELFSAFSQISSPAKLLIVGSPEGIDTLNQDIYNNAKSDSNITFHAPVTDIERYFAAFDVLVLPSYREGFGNVIIEAAAVGTPAIITNIPGPVDAVIPHETAKVVEVKNDFALKNAMEEILNNKADLLKMSEDAYKFVSNHFDSDKLNEKILERKNSLIENKC